MSNDSKTEVISSDFSTCPKCNYRDGFHISLKPREHAKTEAVFICPSCHSRFDTGWIIDINN